MDSALRALRVFGYVARLGGRYRLALVLGLIGAVGWFVLGLGGDAHAGTVPGALADGGTADGGALPDPVRDGIESVARSLRTAAIWLTVIVVGVIAGTLGVLGGGELQRRSAMRRRRAADRRAARLAYSRTARARADGGDGRDRSRRVLATRSLRRP